MNNNEDAVNQVFSDYYKAFSTLSVQSILRYFHQPALLIGPSGVIALPTPEAVVPIFGPVMENLRQRDYRRSEFNLQQLRLLSATSALAMGVAIRYKTDGQEMERVGLTYLLHKGDGGWKFAVMALHDADKVAPSNWLSLRACCPRLHKLCGQRHAFPRNGLMASGPAFCRFLRGRGG
jgi:ketosteroid isomerase-like protein